MAEEKYKLERAMRINLSKKSKFKSDNGILVFMELKMRVKYNPQEGSMYKLSETEKRVIKKNLDDIMISEYCNSVTDFNKVMISNIRKDILNDELCKYNKHALITIINIIRSYWVCIDENATIPGCVD